jgi:cell division septation protein DedD
MKKPLRLIGPLVGAIVLLAVLAFVVPALISTPAVRHGSPDAAPTSIPVTSSATFPVILETATVAAVTPTVLLP